MSRAILTVLLIVLLNVLVGCEGMDSGRGQVVPAGAKEFSGTGSVAGVATAAEADIVEQVSINRQAYRRYLGLLVEHYTKSGNNMKLMWAEKELAGLDAVVQYNYIVEASLAGPNLKAVASIAEADYMYDDAWRTEKKARGLIIIVDENLLRVALDKYNQLIKRHPSSNKIDDAAFRAAGIYEHFQDYSIAALYYQRASQWDPDTVHPAAFKAAYNLDRRLHRRAEALELYQQAVKNENLSINYRAFAEKRIKELTRSDQGGEEGK